MTTAILTLEIKSYWHPGTGHGAGTALDTLTHRDADGLPELPGKTLRGLLREAVLQAEAFGWFGPPRKLPPESADEDPDREPLLAEALFGWRTRDRQARPHRVPATGCLRVGSAKLPEAVRDAIKQHRKDGTDLRSGLYRQVFTTAVDHPSGTALEHALRGAEVIVPLTLQARLSSLPNRVEASAEDGDNGLPEDWPQLLEPALHLLRGLGSQRHRGLGRVAARLDKAPEIAPGAHTHA